MIENTCYRTSLSSAKLKMIFYYTFPIMFAENAVNYDTSRMVYGHRHTCSNTIKR
jgi:hypothetical protein